VEGGVAWRTADLVGLRAFWSLRLDEIPPERSTISRRGAQSMWETHRAVFTWSLRALATADLVKGKTSDAIVQMAAHNANLIHHERGWVMRTVELTR
jgi:hypothetical protein